MTADLRTILTTAFISSVFAPMLLLVVQRFFAKRKEGIDIVAAMQEIADHAVDDLRKERDENRTLRDQMSKTHPFGEGELWELIVRIRNGPKPMVESWKIHRAPPGTGPLEEKKARE